MMLSRKLDNKAGINNTFFVIIDFIPVTFVILNSSIVVCQNFLIQIFQL